MAHDWALAVDAVSGDIQSLLAAFREPLIRDRDDTVPSGRGLNVLQARRLVTEGHAEWVTEPCLGSSRRWEWRLRDASS